MELHKKYYKGLGSASLSDSRNAGLGVEFSLYSAAEPFLFDNPSNEITLFVGVRKHRNACGSTARLTREMRPVRSLV